jgi:Flp pilus assembly protein TadB
LATLNRPTSTHLAEQATTTIIGLLIPPGFALLLTAGNIHLDITIPAAASLALAAAGFLIPELTVRAEAAKLRAGFRHALGSFLDLVVVSLASGAGVDQALHDTARAGTGPAYAELRYALTQARDSRIPPWQTLAELGRRLRIDELQHLAATVGLAGTEGATVRTSLQARAAAIRARQLTDTEATALSATERMSLPIVLLLCGFLLLIGYPAITAVLGL